MRINGFEQMKAFYSWVFDNADKCVKPQHISLYVFLLNQNNRSLWVEWFKCPYDLAMQGACIGNKKTYYNCLEDLQNWGLIEYQKGINEWKAPLIRLEPLVDANSVPQSESSEVQNRTSTVPQPTPVPIPQPTPLPTPQGTQSNKHITSNIKQDIGERKKIFYDSLLPYTQKYKKEMLREFFEYWVEPTHNKKKMRFELEKTWDIVRRLRTWQSREKQAPKKQEHIPTYPRLEEVYAGMELKKL